jgi:hypothetical protein
MMLKMVGRDGIEPPTPGFSVIPRVRTMYRHRQTSLTIKRIARGRRRVIERSPRMLAHGFGKVSAKSAHLGALAAVPWLAVVGVASSPGPAAPLSRHSCALTRSPGRVGLREAKTAAPVALRRLIDHSHLQDPQRTSRGSLHLPRKGGGEPQAGRCQRRAVRWREARRPPGRTP